MSDTGWVSPGTVVSDSSVGTGAWSNPDNARASDDSYATVSLANSTSEYLKATNFGFIIPVGSTIDGIEVKIERKSGGAGNIKDSAVRIVKDGSISSTNNYDDTTTWPTSDTDKTYGASDDLWGETWSASDINSSTSGVVVSAVEVIHEGSVVASIDHIQIKVYYTEGGSTPIIGYKYPLPAFKNMGG